MDEKRCDRRVIMTKKFLRESLITLLRSKPIHEVTVKEICERADINRTTFYNHYSSIYELYNDVIDYVFEHVRLQQERFYIRDDLTNTEATQAFLISIFEFAEENRELVLILFGKNGSMNIGEAFSRYIDTFIRANQSSLSSRYGIQFIASGISSILWMWLTENEKVPASKIVDIVATVYRNGFSQLITTD